ncbi:MAG: hypothetical protein KatS3mg005_4152 [Bryobacteraceae bacterium]|nr:MAG: hypothetical protein KatS3mg005_4152 [Bryobacteraceae bacterium]
MTPLSLSIEHEQDLARRAIRGEGALRAAGFANPQSAPALPTFQASPSLTHAVISLTTAGTYVIVPASAGLAIRVFALYIWSENDQNWELFDDTVSLTGLQKAWPMQQGLLLPYVGEPWFELQPNNPLKLSLSGNGQFSGFVKYRYV